LGRRLPEGVPRHPIGNDWHRAAEAPFVSDARRGRFRGVRAPSEKPRDGFEPPRRLRYDRLLA
jgi:hypothetical protein